jgi:hypothetical protein
MFKEAVREKPKGSRRSVFSLSFALARWFPRSRTGTYRQSLSRLELADLLVDLLDNQHR